MKLGIDGIVSLAIISTTIRWVSRQIVEAGRAEVTLLFQQDCVTCYSL